MADTMETLRAATDAALEAARQALDAGHARLSATDIDTAALATGGISTHANEIAAEMGALTLPLGLIGRIRRRRQPVSLDPVEQLVADVVDYDQEAEQYEGMAQAARDRRDELIREALGEGVSASRIADVTGLHIQRVYQIRHGRR